MRPVGPFWHLNKRKEIHMSQTAISIKQETYDAGDARADMKLEVALIPVSDVDRAKEFYTRLGWRLDRDIVMGNDFRLVQFTPPGSGCSITFGKGVTAAAPGGLRNTLIVSDIVAAHKELVARGIDTSEVFHGSPFSTGSTYQRPGSRAPELSLIRHLRRSRRKHVARPGGHASIARSNRSRDDYLCISKRSGKRDAARSSRPWQARKA
jgi:catechol 2,3-dioxygenase-like lactoylglutathione lyase family enzyme